MKKNISLIASLLIFPFLSSCNGSGVTSEVTEEEFCKAIKFEDAQYAQALCVSPDSSNAFTYVSYEFSPTAYLEKGMDTPGDTTFSGKFVTKEGEKYTKYIHDPANDEWEKPVIASESDFNKPNYLYGQYFINIELSGLTYKDFNYNGGTKTYSASNLYYDFSLKFENKKVVNCVFKATDSDQNSKSLTETFVLTLSITYEEKTPRIYKNLPTNTRST